jgi:hypothetical protein
MSATGRGALRAPYDAYETPSWCVQRLLEHVALPRGQWVEPAAGSGAIIRAVGEAGYEVSWTAVELRPEAKGPLTQLHHVEHYIGDFFAWLGAGWRSCPHVIITNPPYRQAERFVEACLPSGAWVVMLMRLNWLASGRRQKLLSEHCPHVYVLPDRPSFTGRGTDATDYAWLVWEPGGGRREGRVEILGRTPTSERRSPCDGTPKAG